LLRFLAIPKLVVALKLRLGPFRLFSGTGRVAIPAFKLICQSLNKLSTLFRVRKLVLPPGAAPGAKRLWDERSAAELGKVLS